MLYPLQRMLILLALVLFGTVKMAGATEGVEHKPLLVHFPDDKIFQSPYTWRNAEGSAIAPTGGAYFKGVVTGTTSIAVNVDTSINAALPADDMPTLKVTIDDAPASFIQFPPGAKRVVLGNTSAAQHRFRVEIIGGNQGKGDGWSGIPFKRKSTAWNLTPARRCPHRPSAPSASDSRRQQHPGLLWRTGAGTLLQVR